MKPAGLNQKAPVDRRYGNMGQGQSVVTHTKVGGPYSDL